MVQLFKYLFYVCGTLALFCQKFLRLWLPVQRIRFKILSVERVSIIINTISLISHFFTLNNLYFINHKFFTWWKQAVVWLILVFYYSIFTTLIFSDAIIGIYKMTALSNKKMIFIEVKIYILSLKYSEKSAIDLLDETIIIKNFPFSKVRMKKLLTITEIA